MSELMVPCPQCPNAIAHLKTLVRTLNSYETELWGKPYDEKLSADWLRIIPHSLTVRCSTCGDRKMLLTEEGNVLLELLRSGMTAPSVAKIPF